MFQKKKYFEKKVVVSVYIQKNAFCCRESSGQQTHEDDDVFCYKGDDPKEKRQRDKDAEMAFEMMSDLQAVEENDEDDDETTDDDNKNPKTLAIVDESVLTSSRSLLPPPKRHKPTDPPKQTNTVTSWLAKANPSKKISSSSMSSAEACAPTLRPDEESPVSKKIESLNFDSGYQVPKSLTSRADFEAKDRNDATGSRPAGATKVCVAKLEERDEFETEDGVIQIYSPAKAVVEVDSKYEKEQAKQMKIMANNLKKANETSVKSKTLGKVMEQRCIMEHHVRRTKPSYGERSAYYLAKIPIVHFK